MEKVIELVKRQMTLEAMFSLACVLSLLVSIGFLVHLIMMKG